MNGNVAFGNIGRIAVLLGVLIVLTGCFAICSRHAVAPVTAVPTGSVSWAPLAPPNAARARTAESGAVIAGHRTFDGRTLVIHNHTGAPLAQLAMSSPVHGQSSGGVLISLSR